MIIINPPIHSLVDRPNAYSPSSSLPSERGVDSSFGNAHEAPRINALKRMNQPTLVLHSQRVIHNCLHRASHRQIVRIPIYPSDP